MNTKSQPKILKIQQKDNYTFTIHWNDGIIGNYCLSELQKHCHCANCVDEITGKPRLDKEPVQQDVRAVRIVSVGRYALRVHFTSGCSAGLYDYDLLYQLRGQ